MNIDDDRCDGCFYSRPMRAWGEMVEACFYKLEKEQELYSTINGECSGYEDAEKQMELRLEEPQ